MATLTVTTTVNHINGDLNLSYKTGTVSFDQSVQGGRQAVQIIGTSEEAIVTTDITTLGLFVLRNLDATNYVDVGPDSGGTMVSMARIKAGEFAVFRAVPGITIKAQANTAAVKLLVAAYEN